MILEISPESPRIVHVAAATILYLHIGGGLVALASGALSLAARKGSHLHRSAGNVFFVSMLIMASIGAAVSPFLAPPQWVNVVAGTFTLYLVATAWITVKRKAPSRPTDIATFVVASAIAAAAIGVGLAETRSAASGEASSDAGPAFVFAAIVTLAAIGDLRIVLKGSLTAVQRLTRHLWRMCCALAIAAGSLFLGQPQVFPNSIRSTGLLFVPVVLVFGLMIYWLIRVRFTKTRIVAATQPAS